MSHVRFDWALKKILRSKANFEILEGFLSEVLRYEVKILRILESESNKESKESKLNRVDILVETLDKKLMIIEVQNSSEIDYFHRMAFSAARIISEYLDQGQSYGKIKKVITINIVYFELGQGGDYIYYGNNTFRGLHNPNDCLQLSKRQMKEFNIKNVHEIFPEHYIIKVNNFNDLAKDTLDEWIYFLKNSKIEDSFTAKGLGKARVALNELNLTEDERIDYKIHKKQLHDEATFIYNAKIELKENFESGLTQGIEQGKIEGKIEGIKEGKKEGIKEGIERGRREQALEFAKKLLLAGMNKNEVLKMTGLKEDDLI